MKRSDISDDHVLELARAWQRDTLNAPGVVAALVAEGVPEKLAVRKVEHMSDRGLMEYGTSPYYARVVEDPIDRARELLRAIFTGHDT